MHLRVLGDNHLERCGKEPAWDQGSDMGISLEKLYDCTADRPDVRGGGRARLLDDLGRHPVRGTSDVLHLTLHRPEVERDTEVRQLDVAILGRQNIRRLQIAVDDVVLMQIVQSFEDLHYIIRDEPFVELPERLQGLTQRAVLGVPGNT